MGQTEARKTGANSYLGIRGTASAVGVWRGIQLRKVANSCKKKMVNGIGVLEITSLHAKPHFPHTCHKLVDLVRVMGVLAPVLC